MTTEMVGIMAISTVLAAFVLVWAIVGLMMAGDERGKAPPLDPDFQPDPDIIEAEK